MTTQTTTPIEACKRCGGTSFGVFAGPSGRRRRCRKCSQPADAGINARAFNAELDRRTAAVAATGRTSDGLSGEDVFALVARNNRPWTS